MNIQAKVCPFNHQQDSQKAAESSLKSATPPAEDGKFSIDDIICPFQRAAYNEGELHVDANGEATNLPEVLKKFAGASWLLTGIANHGAKKLTAGADWPAFKADSYNVQDLEGSTLDHTADSQILRGGFNQKRLDFALSFSSDGERLTEADLRRFQKANLEEEPGERGEFLGAAEFALLIKVFGRTDGLGTKFIKNKDLTSLYKDAKWPDGWEPPKPGSLNLWTAGIAVKEFMSDKLGTEQIAAPSAKKAGGQVCPFLSGQDFDMGEAAKKHADKLQ